MNTANTGDAFVKIKAGESGGSVLEFESDEGDDYADLWRIQNAGDGLLGFRTKASGSWVEKLRIEAAGTAKFSTSQVHLYNSANTSNTYFYAQNTGAGNAGIKLKNNQGEWTIIANDRLRFIDDDASSKERLSILSTGNVGINDTNPNAKLVVKQDGLTDNTYSFAANYRSGNNASGYTASGISISGTADNSNGEKHTSYINFSSRDPSLNGSHGASAWITMSNPNSQGTYGSGQLDFYVRNGSAYTFKNDPQAPSSYWMSSILTVKSDGNVVIGKSSNFGSGGTTGIELYGGSYSMFVRGLNVPMYVGRNSSTGTVVSYLYNGTERGKVQTDGTVIAYNTSSDYRLKENEVAITNGIEKIKQLKPYTFNFKETPSKIDQGFFAHEVQTVVPGAVTGTKDAVALEDDSQRGITKGDIEPQQMDYAKLTPLLTAALQEAIAEIETLKSEVAALKSS
tara:strand:- start:9874 stop:11238 length:1365 start_codon:yes stop_codon:yes gene_type:complete